LSILSTKAVETLWYCLTKAVPWVLLQKREPLILGLVITDNCNLKCKHCRLANTGRAQMVLAVVEQKLRAHHAAGARALYIEGGEPFLWREGDKSIEDVVKLARQIGYLHVAIYTNGILPLASSADQLWVSVDGLQDNFVKLRGNHFDTVMENIRNAQHRKMVIVFVINQWNKKQLRAFLEFSLDLPVMGVMFYFHTPYYGKDELFIEGAERQAILDELMQYKRAGLPVFNSFAGLKLLKSERWPKSNGSWVVTDVDGDYVCCRHNSPEICADCGYASCTEVIAAQRLSPSALANVLRCW
jgi:Fe-coproporphyrin III synthase